MLAIIKKGLMQVVRSRLQTLQNFQLLAHDIGQETLICYVPLALTYIQFDFDVNEQCCFFVRKMGLIFFVLLCVSKSVFLCHFRFVAFSLRMRGPLNVTSLILTVFLFSIDKNSHVVGKCAHYMYVPEKLAVTSR